MYVHDNPHLMSSVFPAGSSLKDAAERAIRLAGIQEDVQTGKFYVLDSRTIDLLAVSIYEWLVSTGKVRDRESMIVRWRATPGWIAVTSNKQGTWAEQERNLEACLTAVQRVTLSMWRDEISCEWLPLAECNEPQFLDLIGADSYGERPVGVILYGEADTVGGIR